MILLAIILGILPSLVWLFFFLQEDIHPEPKRLILKTFCIGGLMALPVVALQLLTQDAITFFNFKNIIISIIALALIEEVFKFIAAYWTTYKNPEFDEPIDAMVYMITAALGFAMVENSLIMGSAIAFDTIALRFIGATLLHSLASGLLGYYWALGIKKNFLIPNLSFGLFLATLVHVIFNYLILKFQSNYFIFPGLFLTLAAVFVFIDFEKLRKMI
jgi:RsiW-degrading membrane proteinase PrsW (M82 family)